MTMSLSCESVLLQDHLLPACEADHEGMRLALAQAHLAYQAGEVPVGAIITDAQGQQIAAGFNQTISTTDPTAHAEIVALRQAAKVLSNYRLPGLTVYVTLEPCLMCMGALFNARIERIVFGAHDAKTGVCGSVLTLQDDTRLNHHAQVQGGVLADECVALLRQFFRERREQARQLREQQRQSAAPSPCMCAVPGSHT